MLGAHINYSVHSYTEEGTAFPEFQNGHQDTSWRVMKWGKIFHIKIMRFIEDMTMWIIQENYNYNKIHLQKIEKWIMFMANIIKEESLSILFYREC